MVPGPGTQVRRLTCLDLEPKSGAWAWASGTSLEGRTQKAQDGVFHTPGCPRRRVAGGREGTTHRRRPREKTVYGRVTWCCGDIGKRHSDQDGKEPGGRPYCATHKAFCGTGTTKFRVRKHKKTIYHISSGTRCTRCGKQLQVCPGFHECQFISVLRDEEVSFK
jgi:hypothetical protein